MTSLGSEEEEKAELYQKSIANSLMRHYTRTRRLCCHISAQRGLLWRRCWLISCSKGGGNVAGPCGFSFFGFVPCRVLNRKRFEPYRGRQRGKYEFPYYYSSRLKITFRTLLFPPFPVVALHRIIYF